MIRTKNGTLVRKSNACCYRKHKACSEPGCECWCHTGQPSSRAPQKGRWARARAREEGKSCT